MATRRGINMDSTQQTDRGTGRQNLYISVSKIDIKKVKPKVYNMEDIVDAIWKSNKGNSIYAPGVKDGSGEFEKMGFLHSQKVKDVVLAQLGFQQKRIINNIVMFYFRKYGRSKYEMFAVTNNNDVRNFVRQFADPNFPDNVGRRMQNLPTKFEDPTGLNLPRQPRTRYTVTLQDDASILPLDCFQNQKVTVTVDIQFIGFDQRIQVEDVEKIVDHLAIISRREDMDTTYGAGEETGKIESDPLESYHSRGLIRVDKGVQKLDKKLAELVYGFLGGEEYGNCNLSSADAEEFAQGLSFQLRWQGDCPENIYVWFQCPSLKDVITAIRDWEKYQCEFAADIHPLSGNVTSKKKKKAKKTTKKQDLCMERGIDAFHEWFLNIKFSFKSKNGDELLENESLLHLINGTVNMNKKQYWHLNNNWFQVTDDYLSDNHYKFIDLLTATLIPKGNNEHSKINHPYPQLSDNRESVAEYVRKYKNDKNFIVGDQAMVINNAKLFDLLYYDEENDKVFLYHIKEGFERNMKNVCSQMTSSAQIISRNLGLPNSHASDEFKALCLKIVNSYKSTLPKICDKLETFKKALARAHFVYAVADTEQTFKSFFSEMKLKTKINAKDLENELSRYNRKGFLKSLSWGFGCGESQAQVTAAIISKLKKSGYVDPRSGNITAKLIHLKEKEFLEESRGWLNGGQEEEFRMESFGLLGDDTATSKSDNTCALRSVFHAICKLYCTYYDNMMPKSDLLRTRLKVQELGFLFRICEIQMASTVPGKVGGKMF